MNQRKTHTIKPTTGTEYRQGENLHRTDGPAHAGYHPDDTVEREAWYRDGDRHREDQPAYIRYHQGGTVAEEYWFVNGTHIPTPPNR